MRERYHSNVVVVLKERESVAELAVVNEATGTANGTGKLVLGYFAIEELGDVISVETCSRNLCRKVFLRAKTVVFRVYFNRVNNDVVDRVHVGLMNFDSVADVEPIKGKP